MRQAPSGISMEGACLRSPRLRMVTHMKSTAIVLAAGVSAALIGFGSAQGAADCTWEPSPVTVSAEQTGLADVAAASATSAWAVGSEYEYDVGREEALIYEWDGLTWSDAAPPAVAVSHALHSVARIPGTSEAWAVGGKRDNDDETPIVMRRTSEGWELADMPGAPGRLLGVTARSETDAWAVGYDEENRRSLILHWDGVDWQRVPAPSPGDETILRSVVALGANNVWAVGRSEHARPGEGRLRKTLALRWNGASWKTVTTPNVGALSNFLEDVNRIPGTSKLWAVGYRHNPDQQAWTYKTLAMRWNGSAWRVFPTPSIGTHSTLETVTPLAGSDVWAFGVNSPNARFKALMLHWDGSNWTKKPGPSDTFGGWLEGSSPVPGSDRIWTAGVHFPPGADGDEALIVHGCG